MIDVSELMRDPDFTTTITRLRPTVALAHEGESETTYDAGTVLTAIVQPARDSDLKLLEEGTRRDNAIVVYVASGVLVEGDGNTTSPDIVVYEGQNYRVKQASHFEANGYTKVVASNYVKGTPI